MWALLVPLFTWLVGAIGWLLRFFGGWIFVGLGTFLSVAIVPLAKKVLLGLGFGMVMFQGVDLLLTNAYEQIQLSVGTMPSLIIALFAWLDVDKMLSLLVSAYTTKAALTLASNTGFFRKAA